MKIYKELDYDAVSLVAAQLVANQIKEKEDSILGLATGSSPVGMYKELVDMYNAGEISFKKIRTVNLDEYAGLADDDVNSYHYFMNQHLFSKVDIDPTNTHLPNGIVEDPDAECAYYEAMVQSLGGADLQVLGLGDGPHVVAGRHQSSPPFCWE